MVGVVLCAHHLAQHTPANMAAIQFNDIFSNFLLCLRARVINMYDNIVQCIRFWNSFAKANVELSALINMP